MSEKTLKWIIFFWGTLSLVIFISIRFQPLFNGLLKEKVVENYWDETQYGEMYYFSMIKHFREEGLPPAQRKFEYSEKQASVEDSRILAFGDSFFEFSRHKQFPERLHDDFNLPVHYVNEDFPLEYLLESNYHDTLPKIVLYERTERYIPISFDQKQETLVEKQLKADHKVNFLTEVKNKLFYDKSEELFGVILKRSYLTSALYSSLVTLKFNWFGQISSLTPVYSVEKDNSWLFYHDQVNEEKTSFYYKHSEAEIDSICDHMASLAERLEEEYNMYLVYLPIPAKYTLYHGIVNSDEYNNFLPRLYEGLGQRGVKVVDIYETFRDQTDTLYYRTDSHWNQLGLDLAYENTIEAFRRDSIINEILLSGQH